MSTSMYESPAIPETRPGAETKLAELCNKRRQQGMHDRKKYEPTWHLCQAFLAGRQWTGWSPKTRQVVEEPNPHERERHTENVITQYHATVLGKLYVEDLRPDLLFRREDIESQEVATHSQQVARFAWDTELEADRRVYLGLHKMLTFGTSALRCLFDPSQGNMVGEFPVGPDGQPIVDPEQARAFMAEAMQRGERPEMKTVREGRIMWEPLSPFAMITPPGVEEPDYFPWLIVDRVMPTEWAKNRWPDKEDKIREMDLRLEDGNSAGMGNDSSLSQPGAGKLIDHTRISCLYEMPTREYQEGREIYWTQNEVLEERGRLPYKLKGRPHHGVIMLRFHLIDGRFWGKGVVEDLIGPQRQRNRARSQMIEMKDRNLGRVYAKKGTITSANTPVGKIMELVEVAQHADFPVETQGTAPGDWIRQEADMNDMAMDKIAGLSDVSMSQAPPGASAYSSLALLAEQDERRIGPVLKDVRTGIGDAVLLTLELIKQYWQKGKHMAIAGPDGHIEEFMYDSTLLPAEFHLDVSRNAPLPTSPAAESQKIFDLFHAATSAGQPLPPEWLKDSLDAGRPLPFPKRAQQMERHAVQVEHYLMQKGELVQPQPFHDHMLHLQDHRMEQMQNNGVPGQEQYLQILDQHIQWHEMLAMQMQPTAMPGGAGGVQVPQLQGGHGIEAQNGVVTNFKAAAQTATGSTPNQNPGGGNGGRSY